MSMAKGISPKGVFARSVEKKPSTLASHAAWSAAWAGEVQSSNATPSEPSSRFLMSPPQINSFQRADLPYGGSSQKVRQDNSHSGSMFLDQPKNSHPRSNSAKPRAKPK